MREFPERVYDCVCGMWSLPARWWRADVPDLRRLFQISSLSNVFKQSREPVISDYYETHAAII